MASVNFRGESLPSETGSSPCSDGKYQVERILAQDEDDGEIMYLVKWEGYGDEQCTWELAESFDTPVTISMWQKQLAQGDVPSDEQVDQILARMEAFRSQQADLETQEKAVTENKSEESKHNDGCNHEPHHSPPTSSGAEDAITAPVPPKVAPEPHSKKEIYQDSTKTASTAMASKPIPYPPSKTTEASHLKKRRRSSTDQDEESRKTLPPNKSRRTHSKQNQAPPPVGLIKPCEIGHREPGHTLPAISTAGRPDPLPSPSANSQIKHGSLEISPSYSRSQNIQTRHKMQDYAPENPSIPPAQATRRVSSNGLNPGDLIMYLGVGSRKIGHVTLSGLPNWLWKSLCTLKTEDSLSLHFETDFVVTWKEYNQISSGWLPPSSNLGYVEVHPFQNSLAANNALARHFEESDRGAIWVHPNPNETYALVLHVSTLASYWGNAQYHHKTGDAARLLVGVRNRVGKGQLPGPLVIPPNLRESRVSSSLPKLLPPQPLPPRFGSNPQTHTNETNSIEEARKHVDVQAQSLPNRHHMSAIVQVDENSTTGSKPGINHEVYANRVSSKGQNLVSNKASSPEKSEVPNKSVVAKKCSATGVCDLDYRSMTPGLTNTKPLVYIAFGGSHPTEAREVAKWASQYTSTRFLFLDTQEEDQKEWRGFVKACGTNPALLLFRDDPVFCNLRHFGSQLGKYPASTLRCFRLSWQISDPQLPKYTQIQIFTHGTVVLLTEAAMKKQAATAVKILEWFKSYSKAKSNHTWMIMVRPNIRAWLTHQAIHDGLADEDNNKSEDDDDSRAHYVQMLRIFSELMPAIDVTDDQTTKLGPLEKILARTSLSESNYVIPLTRLPGYDSSPEAATTDQAQLQRRDEILLSHFVGWSAMHVERHRRFLVLLADDDNDNDNHDDDDDDEQTGDGKTRLHSQLLSKLPHIYNNANHIVFMKVAGFAKDIDKSSERHQKRH